MDTLEHRVSLSAIITHESYHIMNKQQSTLLLKYHGSCTTSWSELDECLR